MDAATSPDLFTQPERPSYASATAAGAQNLLKKHKTEQEIHEWCTQLEREEEKAIMALRASRGRKRNIPTPSQSDDEQGGPHKKSMTPGTSTDSESEQDTIGNNSTESASSTPTEQHSILPPAGLRHFMTATDKSGSPRTLLMKAVPGDLYYRCRGYYLHYKHGDFNAEKARKVSARNSKENTTWAALKGTVKQDAFPLSETG